MSRSNGQASATGTGNERPRTLEAAARGIASDDDFANMLDAVICDVLEGKLAHQQGDTVIRGLKVRLHHAIEKEKRGRTSPQDPKRDLIGRKAA